MERMAAPKHTLPVALTSFLGREQELGIAVDLLRERRLVTFTGAGGCGKTRLAIEAARCGADRFSDGVWFVDLTPATDAAGVARAVLAALGLHEILGESADERVAEFLGDRWCLLVLDNCEQVLAQVAGLAWRLVQRCARAQVLATSREPLGINGEAVYRVPSLKTPEREDDTGCASVQLFLDRVLLSNAPAGVAARDLPDVVGICSRLDGIPLAIELAAAACGVLMPPQIAGQLTEHLDPSAAPRRRSPDTGR